jgi:D-alanyl-D-alanine carboxypeptidase/D-alanyl-D-alanine-endopeptidase (penicillin-binding protein 4)
MRLKLLFLLFFLTVATNITSQLSGDNHLQNYVNTIVGDKNLKGSLFSMKMVNFETGETVFEYKPELKMVPASILKVITTGTGFVNLGENYVFRTSVYYDGTIASDSLLNGNLYIAGGGDPSLCSKNFPDSAPEIVFGKIAGGLRYAGISGINGRIIVDASYFDGLYSTPEPVHPSWEWEDIGSYYGAGARGFNFCENAFTVKVSCGESGEIRVFPEYPYAEFVSPEIISDVTVINKDSLPDIMSFSSPSADRHIIRGEMPEGKEISLNCALLDPSGAFVFWLKNYLSLNGVTVYDYDHGDDSVFNRDRYLLTEIESPPYREIARYANYVSNNLFADAIFKTVSRLKTGEASFAKSAVYVNRSLKALDLNPQDIRIVDGSGLSRHNFMTAGFMCEYLCAIKRHVPDFHLSLPSPGTKKSTLRYIISSHSESDS